MIPKANQRAGGQQLATHLLNAYDNDRVELASLRGAVAPDLHGAFAEWRAMAEATQCRKYLYSLSINPDHTQGPFKRDHYFDFIARTEEKLGLAEQPRAVVFHVKHGREHCHVVWSRIDPDRLKAVQLSHDRQKLRSVAQEFAKDHGITLPPGMQNNRGKDRFNERAELENLAEKQQEERSGITKHERRQAITAAWRQTATAKDFVSALEKQGYLLARGESRAYVVVDLAGEIHSLARQIEGAKTKDVKIRLASYPQDKIPDVATAQDRARKQRDARAQAQETPLREPEGFPKSPEKTPEQRRAALRDQQQQRRLGLEEKRLALVKQHTNERDALKQLHAAEDKGILGARVASQPKGIVAFLARITGIQALVSMHFKRQDQKRGEEHRSQSEALKRRHDRELQDFSHFARALARVEKRENRSLQTALHREEFRTIAAPAKTPELTPAQRAKVEEFRRTADQFRTKAVSARQPQRGKTSPQLTPEQRAKIEEFKRTAGQTTAPQEPKPQHADGGLSAAFNDVAGRTKAPEEKQDHQIKQPPSRLPALLDNAGDITAPPAASARAHGGLADTFRKSAEPEKQEPQQLRENAADITKPAPAPAPQPENLPGGLPETLKDILNRRAAIKRREREAEERDKGGPDQEKHHHRPPPDPWRFPRR